MTVLEQMLCFLGFHVIDAGEFCRRKLRMARMGVDVSGTLPCNCTRCGRVIWR